MVKLSGSAYEKQWKRMGKFMYHKKTANGYYVYRQNNAYHDNQYLFMTSNDHWMVSKTGINLCLTYLWLGIYASSILHFHHTINLHVYRLEVTILLKLLVFITRLAKQNALHLAQMGGCTGILGGRPMILLMYPVVRCVFGNK